MKVLLVGAKGKLGGFLAREWAARFELEGLSRAELDLRDLSALSRELAGREFEVLVNCAAVASPDRCEEDAASAWAVNAEAPRVMAEACRERGARMVHFSTDYVLDGTEEGLKDETAATAPNGVYGASKRAGEEAVLEVDPSSLVGRVSWVFGTDPVGFCEAIVRRAQAGEPLEAIADKWSLPTYARDIAGWVEALIPRGEVGGVVHLTHIGEPESWWSYGSKVLEQAYALGLLEKRAKIIPRKMAEVGIFQVPRPVHTAMAPRRMCTELGLSVRDWESAAAARLALMARGRESH